MNVTRPPSIWPVRSLLLPPAKPFTPRVNSAMMQALARAQSFRPVPRPPTSIFKPPAITPAVKPVLNLTPTGVTKSTSTLVPTPTAPQQITNYGSDGSGGAAPLMPAQVAQAEAGTDTGQPIPWLWIAAGVAALFLLSRGRR